MILLKYNSTTKLRLSESKENAFSFAEREQFRDIYHRKINKKSRFYERYRASLFRFFKMKSVLYLTFFLYLCSRFEDFAINSARNSSSDLFPNQRGL